MATISVSNPSELGAALGSADAGDTIRLAGGDYGTLSLNAARMPRLKFADTVTIASADPNRPAVFDKLDLQGIRNVTLDGLDFEWSAENGWSPFRISGVSDVDIRNARFDGEPASGYGRGTGLLTRNSTDVTIEKSEFVGFLRGMEFFNMEDLEVLQNNVHGFTGDGMTFAQVRGGRIAGNHIHDTNPNPASGFHMDGIQFWTVQTKLPTAGVTIQGNLIEPGDGRTQGIFMGNEVGTSRAYQDIVIAGNAVVSGHINGIRVSHANGLDILDNAVLQDTGISGAGKINKPQIHVSPLSSDVSVTDNVVHSIYWEGRVGAVLPLNRVVGVGTELSDIWPGWKPGAVGVDPTPAPPSPPSRPSPSPEEPAPAPGDGEVPLAALATPQSRAFYEDLAQDLGLDFALGAGGAGGDLVLSRDGQVAGGAGDDILVGGAGNNWISTGPGDDVVAGLGGVDVIRFNGQHVGGGSSETVVDLDFAERDRVELFGYDQRTFPGAGNTAALVNSLDDFARLAAGSSAVSAAAEGDTLVLRIEQDAGTQTIRLLGLGDDFALL